MPDSERCHTAIFTIIAKNYLPYARVLMRSAAAVHPEWRRFVILVDRVDGYFDPHAEDFEIVLSSDLPIPRSHWFHFKYSIMELSTAVKPYAFEHLFNAQAFDRIVYLDPDIRIYSPLYKVAEALDTANIALTPHLTASLDDDRRPAEIDILRAGAYNLGFIAVSRSDVSAAFLAWWQQRLHDHCVVDLPRGLFVDQKWVDLVPGMFEGVALIRDAGYNVAYWNLTHRIVSVSNGGYEVAGSPLAFFHFSGYDAEHPDRLSCHQNRFKVENLPSGTQQLLQCYRAELLAAGYLSCRNWPYAHATFQNGVRIPDLGRPIHHEAPHLLMAIDDPFSDEGFQAFVDSWNAPVKDDDGAQLGISRLAYRIYRTRTDVQSAMPDIFGGHYKRFLEWMLVSGRTEHGLGDVFLTTVADAIATCKDQQKARAWPETTAPDELGSEVVGHPDGHANGGTRLRLTRLAAAIYEARPELQNYFPDPCGNDSARFLVWLLTYGKKEHYLSPAHIAPMKAQWRTIVEGLPKRSTRVRYELILTGMTASAYVRGCLARLPILRAKLARLRPRFDGAPAGGHPSVAVEPPPSREYGVNLVGYFYSETGVGQSVRAARAALQAAPVPLSVRCVGDSGPSRKQDYSAGPMSSAFPYFTNLFYVNADQTAAVQKSLGERFYRHRHNIGYWVWELDEFPERWLGAFAPYQEVWTPSTFCRNAIARKASVPVLCFPYAVAPAAPAGMDRQHFGLAADRFLFLTAFDVLSVMERKNPLAAIQAFEKAFGPDSSCQMLIKVNNASARPECVETLRKACSNGSVRILDSTLRREEMDALTNCVDCVVSLHRSEGFGLLLAEAMYFGKPVIVTNYSGNTDFTRSDNSMLVDYRMIPVGHNCAPYDPASLWADPDVEQAASHMRAIAGNVELRLRLSNAGQAFVRDALSPEAVGKAMCRRLEALRATSDQPCPPDLAVVLRPGIPTEPGPMNDPREGARYDCDMPALGGRSLLFLHIPKAAGTSFTELLRKRFGSLDVLSVGLERPGGVTRSLADAEKFSFVHGHFPYDAVGLFSRRPFLSSVLREPIDRATSAFWFMKQQSSHMERLAASGHLPGELVNDFAKARALSLCEFVHNEPRAAARHLGNLQVEFLTCADLDRRYRFDQSYEIDVSTRDLDLAKERLSTFDAFGLFERLPESAEYLAYALQTRPFGDVEWCNKTRSRPAVEDIDESTMAELRRLTYYDRQLYAFATELFELRRRAMLNVLLAGHANAISAPHQRRRPSLFTSGMKLPGEGWYAAESDGNRWFNWTGPGSESWIELGTPEGSEFELRIGVLHALRPESLFELEVLVNDAQLKPEVSRDSDGHTICAPVPARVLRGVGMSNTVTLRVPHVSRACDCDPTNEDTRSLGIAVYRIGLQRVSSGDSAC